MFRKQHAGALLLCSMVTIATVAGWMVGTQTTANGSERLRRAATSDRENGDRSAQIPAHVLNELIYEQVETVRLLAASRGDSADQLPTYEELQLTCDGDVILIWWTNDDGETE